MVVTINNLGSFFHDGSSCGKIDSNKKPQLLLFELRLLID
jgi:hypothetical protein